MIYSFDSIQKIKACYSTEILLEYAPNGIFFDLIYKKLQSFFLSISKGLKVIHDVGFVTPFIYDINHNVYQDCPALETFYDNRGNPTSLKAAVCPPRVLPFEPLFFETHILFSRRRTDAGELIKVLEGIELV